jgi:radical SAM superfamily enzyme YgiQ (UPF0313 family)
MNMSKPKVIFIVPPFSEHAQRKGKSSKSPSKKSELRVYPSLGICYLISSLENDKKINCDIELIDSPAENMNMEELINELHKRNPSIICITMTTFTLRATKLLVDACRKQLPSSKIVLGGIHLNHSPEEFVCFDADYGLRGDCEYTIRELIKAMLLHKNEDIKKIKGIIYRGNQKLIISSPATIENLDLIPFPDRTRLKAEKYIYPLFNKKFTTLIGSRGCPYKCIYCGLPHNNKFKTRSVDNILKELRLIASQGYEYVSFSDDIFTMNKHRVIELCKGMISQSIDLIWGCATRADCVDYELLVLMKKAGCMDIRFGIESGNDRVRNQIIHKNIPDSRYIEVIAMAKKAGLITIGFFLFGQPTETLKEMEQTITFAKRLKLDYASFGITVPIPNSELFNCAINENKTDKNIWKDVIYGKKEIPFYSPETVSIKKMKVLLAKANRSFYLRPKYILDQISNVHSLGALLFKIRIGFNFLKNRARK